MTQHLIFNENIKSLDLNRINKTYNIWVSNFLFFVPVKFDKKSVNFKYIIS